MAVEAEVALRHAPADTLGRVACMDGLVITRIAEHTAGVVHLIMLQISLLQQEDAARPAHAICAHGLGGIDVVIVRDAYTQMVSARRAPIIAKSATIRGMVSNVTMDPRDARTVILAAAMAAHVRHAHRAPNGKDLTNNAHLDMEA